MLKAFQERDTARKEKRGRWGAGRKEERKKGEERR